MTREEAIKILEYPVKKWSMEWDEREDGLSYYEALDMAISALRQQETVANRNGLNEPTNADRIRSMTDEELAEFLIDLADDGNLRIREWLQQPSGEEDKHEP